MNETTKNIDILISASEISPERIQSRAVAVIDVFRATSVITSALQSGAESVIPVTGIEDAFRVAAGLPPGTAILGGERNAVKVEGFDLGNSPRSYTPEITAGKTVVLSTTNGTRAIEKCRAAADIFVACFLNMEAVCRSLAETGKNITLVCSGRLDRFTTEDGLCAGAMAGILRYEYGFSLSDMSILLSNYYRGAEDNLPGALEGSLHYEFMKSIGLDEDIRFCLQRNIYDITPRYGDGRIKI